MDNTKSDQRASQTQHFFSQLEDQILRRLHVEASSDEGRAELLRSTGIQDVKLLDELGRLGIPADGVVALRLFPLALVSWAEDDTDDSERNTVMAAADQLGIAEGTTAWIVLDQWLTKRPPGLGVDAWKRYTHEIFAKMSIVAQKRLIELAEKQMTAVAKASGGSLGIGSVSKKEKAIIHQVVTAMRQQMSTK
ncbi:hypothetical protein [Stieleria marina]